MRHLDLFSGIGGFALAAQWAGMQTVGFSEIDEFACKVLAKNFPGIPNLGDIKNVEKIECDIITGGYPCQPFSVAGSQKAQADDRHLWPEMFRVVSLSKPTWVVCENVYGHIKLGVDDVLADLEGLGYTAQPIVLPALAKGTNHGRDRIFVVAYSPSDGCDEGSASSRNEATDGNRTKRAHKDRDHEGCRRVWPEMEWGGCSPWGWGTKPPALRVDDGLPDRMDRNRALGNAIVPQVAYEILRCIAEIENRQNVTCDLHGEKTNG
jgi:DNA (cytosine-5)-methyltransferase 1